MIYVIWTGHVPTVRGWRVPKLLTAAQGLTVKWTWWMCSSPVEVWVLGQRETLEQGVVWFKKVPLVHDTWIRDGHRSTKTTTPERVHTAKLSRESPEDAHGIAEDPVTWMATDAVVRGASVTVIATVVPPVSIPAATSIPTTITTISIGSLATAGTFLLLGDLHSELPALYAVLVQSLRCLLRILFFREVNEEVRLHRLVLADLTERFEQLQHLFRSRLERDVAAEDSGRHGDGCYYGIGWRSRRSYCGVGVAGGGGHSEWMDGVWKLAA